MTTIPSTADPGTRDRQSAHRRIRLRHRRSAGMAVLSVVLSLITGCAARAGAVPGLPASSPNENYRPAPRRAPLPDTGLERSDQVLQVASEGIAMTRRLFLERVTPVAVTLGMLIASPVHAFQELEGQTQDKPIGRRRAPENQRPGPQAFARTELFFGTAKPGGSVTEEEFSAFLDEFVTPLFPDGVTIVKANGQFRGADGVTIKEESFVLILLYPVEGHKTSSRNIDAIRRAYMTRHRQESVLRVDDPFLVWVSF
jgi:hypothetical protein